jgi:hypothetical protein
MNTATDSLETNTQKTGGGLVVGQSATDLIGFYGATTIAQPSGASQGALTDSTVGTASTILAPLTGTYNSAIIVANFASLAVQTNAIRAALVSLGLIKGSA